MAKNLLQDMVRVRAPMREIEREKISNKIKQNNKGSKYRIYFVALIAVIFLLFALSFLFSGTKVTIIPKVKEIPINENLSATKDSNIPGLSFDLVVISGEESKTIQGGEEKDVSIVAKGTVLIFNSFSVSSQTFNADTKLEGSNGKIYKTVKKVVVPGIKKDGKPGSVEVDIYATSAGEEYNSAPIDFKIQSLKGTSKYSKFYARSKGEIVGGFKGKYPVVSALEKAGAVSELKALLETKLSKKAGDQIPGGFILFKDATFLNINDKDISFNTAENNLISVSVKGTLYGFLFDEKKLTKKIAEDIIEKYDGNEVYMPNIRDLVFSLSDKESISFTDVKNINFSLSGTPKIIWKVDETKLVSDMLNKKKKDFNQILLQYPAINSAELVVRPFWKTVFPSQSKNIEIIVNYPK